MNERDAMTLLADANPVRVEDLREMNLAVDSVLATSGRQSRRLVLAVAAAAVLAASLIGVFAFNGSSSHPSGGHHSIVDRSGVPGVLNPRGGTPSMAYPLGQCCGKQVSLAEAANALGGPVTLPDTAQVKPSDAGAVQLENSSGDGQKLVDLGISFPKQGLIVQYIQPPISDPLSNYQVAVSNSEGSLIYLNGGVPALTDESQLPVGSPWGFVQFVAGGSTIVVMGHPDEESLQSVAQSILDQIGS